MFDVTHLNLLVAFLAGLATFFASCLLPLVPVYLAYLSGVSLAHHHLRSYRWHIFRASLAFVLGFIFIFILFGELFYSFSHLVSLSRFWLNRLSGLVLIVFGLYLTNILKLTSSTPNLHLHLRRWFTQKNTLHAFLVGVSFGFAWSPCIGPVLGTILLWVARQQTAWLGFQLLLSFGLGLGLPFLFVGLAFEILFPLFKKTHRFTHYLQFISGVIILLAGFLLLLGQFQQISFFLLKFLPVDRFTP